MRTLTLALALARAADALLRPWLADAPLNTIPFIQSHDTGTVYLNATNALDDIGVRFAQTQSGGSVTALLDCGVRAFDWRPSLSADNFLGFAHGPLFVNFSMAAAAAEVAAWAAAHASEQEDALALIIVADCNGPACDAAAAAAFAAAGIRVLAGADGCAAASDLTLGAAMAAGALPGGGAALAIANCPGAPENTYDDRLSCTGFLNVTEGEAFEAAAAGCLAAPSAAELADCIAAVLGIADLPAHFACYTDGSGRDVDVPFERLGAWLRNTTAPPPPAAPGARGLLVALQGCWAQNVQSTVLSFLHDSSLLLDETRAGFNRDALLAWVNATPPRFMEHINLLGVNNACSGAGPALLAELRRRLPGPPAGGLTTISQH
jgi:hypothetical protein